MSLDADHWRARASQARIVAEWIDEEEARRRLLEVAGLYEEIAQIAESKRLIASPEEKAARQWRRRSGEPSATSSPSS